MKFFVNATLNNLIVVVVVAFKFLTRAAFLGLPIANVSSSNYKYRSNWMVYEYLINLYN